MNAGEQMAELLTRSTPSLEAERLILEATEMILELMESKNMNRVDLAKAIGKTKGHVSQLLDGNRNMTLRTLAEIVYTLHSRVQIRAEPLDTDARESTQESVPRHARAIVTQVS